MKGGATGASTADKHASWAPPIFEARDSCMSYIILSHILCVFTDGYAYQAAVLLVHTQGKCDMHPAFPAGICLSTYSQERMPPLKALQDESHVRETVVSAGLPPHEIFNTS